MVVAYRPNNGLGAARGQRPREGSCASYPTRQILHPAAYPSNRMISPFRFTASVKQVLLSGELIRPFC